MPFRVVLFEVFFSLLLHFEVEFSLGKVFHVKENFTVKSCVWNGMFGRNKFIIKMCSVLKVIYGDNERGMKHELARLFEGGRASHLFQSY